MTIKFDAIKTCLIGISSELGKKAPAFQEIEGVVQALYEAALKKQIQELSREQTLVILDKISTITTNEDKLAKSTISKTLKAFKKVLVADCAKAMREKRAAVKKFKMALVHLNNALKADSGVNEAADNLLVADLSNLDFSQSSETELLELMWLLGQIKLNNRNAEFEVKNPKVERALNKCKRLIQEDPNLPQTGRSTIEKELAVLKVERKKKELIQELHNTEPANIDTDALVEKINAQDDPDLAFAICTVLKTKSRTLLEELLYRIKFVFSNIFLKALGIEEDVNVKAKTKSFDRYLNDLKKAITVGNDAVIHKAFSAERHMPDYSKCSELAIRDYKSKIDIIQRKATRESIRATMQMLLDELERQTKPKPRSQEKIIADLY